MTNRSNRQYPVTCCGREGRRDGVMDMLKMETGITPPSPHSATEGDIQNRRVRISDDKHNPADNESPKFAHFSQ
ncbi:unnamed protein product [Sphagnum jensenii]|uniref:Uncharacterized protein n=1 Tax=Sphagnum jensenii TaxID=128206 RepID=A0ABP0VHS8_9BRYO